MSGIYGIFRHDGAPADSQVLARMRAAMSYYGPDGGGAKTEGPVGLGHLLNVLNPEDAFEAQPVAARRGPVVSAARLDNRDALLQAFEITPADASRVSDGQLVGMAFDRWGEDLSPHLQGDWALAAWDAREHRLLLARDACGNATLYFFEGEGFIAFASSMKALLALPGVKKEPDRLRLVQVLVSWQHDAERTAYEGFRRLPWAHAMSVDAEGHSRQWRHWSPEGRELLSYRRDEDYEEAFMEVYTRAVQSCLRTRKPIAATLSGGRDSGSVVALAAPLLAAQGRSLTAYTSVPLFSPDGAGGRIMGDEWEAAHATATMAGANVQHVPVNAAGYGVVQGIEHMLHAHDGPSHAASNHFWLQAIVETAVQNGAGAILTGQWGNAAVSWKGNGSALLELLQGRPRVAARVFLQSESNHWQALKRHALRPLLVPGLRAYRRFKSPAGMSWKSYSALHPEMARRVDLESRMRSAGYDPTFILSPLENLHLRFFWPAFGAGAGIWSEIGARHQISFLDPTSNLSLADFILRVPDDQFRRKGEGSMLLRRALRNRLPAPVLAGLRKGLQGADVGHRVLQEISLIREQLDLLDASPEAIAMLDRALMRRCLEELAGQVTPDTTRKAGLILLRGLGVGFFLRHNCDPGK